MYSAPSIAERQEYAAIIVADGGMTGAMQLPDIAMPAANSGGYPAFFMSGIVTLPVAATFPGPEPLIAPINALETMATAPVPPGILPTRAMIISIQSFMTPVSFRMDEKTRNMTMVNSSEFCAELSMYFITLPQLPVTVRRTMKAASMAS